MEPTKYRLNLLDVSPEWEWIRTDRSGPWDIKVTRVLSDGSLGESRWVMRGSLVR